MPVKTRQVTNKKRHSKNVTHQYQLFFEKSDHFLVGRAQRQVIVKRETEKARQALKDPRH